MNRPFNAFTGGGGGMSQSAADARYLQLTGGAMTGASTLTLTALGTTPTAGLSFINSTAAAAGAQQVSPSLLLEGQGWKTNATAASQKVRYRLNVLPVQGTANPTGTLRVQCDIDNANTWAASPLTLNNDTGAVITSTTSSGAVLTLTSTYGSTTIARGGAFFTCNTNLTITAASGTLALQNAGANEVQVACSTGDLKLTPEAGKYVQFGTHSALGAETVTGFITIKDAGGTTRKVAIVS